MRLWEVRKGHKEVGAYVFQFQKVRLWVWVVRRLKCMPWISIPKGAIMSGQCDTFIAWLPYFNSKRCDYELLLNCRKGLSWLFQFQKVRLWGAHTFALARKAKRYFNSKRCDYEVRFASALVVRVAISIPKGAIMRVSTIANRRVPSYFNSKRCDYEVVVTPASSTSGIFQFQKVRLWELKNNTHT